MTTVINTYKRNAYYNMGELFFFLIGIFLSEKKEFQHLQQKIISVV